METVCIKCGKRTKRPVGNLCSSCARSVFICKKCGSSYKSLKEIGFCRKCRAKGKTFKCDLCDKEFATKKGLMQHKQNHVNIDMFKCTICGKAFSNSRSLSVHKRYHDNSKAKESNDLRKHTNLERYGVTASWSSRQAIDKASMTRLHKYGYKFAMQDKAILDKMIVNSHTEQAEAKRHNTNICKYGVDNPLKNDAIREKARKTLHERYRVNSTFELARTRKTIQERYGVEFISQNDDIKKKVKHSQFKRYGEYAFHQQYAIDKMRMTHLKRLSEDKVRILTDGSELRSVIDAFDRKPTVNDISYKCNVPKCALMTSLRRYKLLDLVDLDARKEASSIERHWHDILSSNGIEFDTEKKIYGDNRRCDILIDRMAIELNPTATHSTFGKNAYGNISASYHFDKSKAAEENGYEVFHVWDWFDDDFVLKVIKSRLGMHCENAGTLVFDEDMCFVNGFVDERAIVEECRKHAMQSCNNGIIVITDFDLPFCRFEMATDEYYSGPMPCWYDFDRVYNDKPSNDCNCVFTSGIKASRLIF